MRPMKTDRWMGSHTKNALGAMFALGLAAMSAVGAAGCDDDDAGTPPGTPDGGPTGDEPGPRAVVVAERVFTPNGRFYYVSVMPEVPTAAVDRSKALEKTSADVEVFEHRVYIRDRDANTITKYKVSDDYKLVEEGKFSFASTGLGTGRYYNAYIKSDLAYALDSGGWRLIGWNPQKMELTGEIISIDNMKKSLPNGAIGQPVKVGNRIVAPIYWADFANLVYFPGSGALSINPLLPQQATFIEDPRIGGAFRISADDSGDGYVTGVVGGDIRKFGSAAGGGALPTSGLIRLPAGLNRFDEDYLVDVEAITNSPGVWAVHRIDGSSLLAQVYDPAVAFPATLAAYNSSTDFIYVKIDTDAKTFAPVAELPRGGRGNAGNHVVDGKLYIQTSDATGSKAFSVDDSGVEQAFPIPAGDVWHLQRVD